MPFEKHTNKFKKIIASTMSEFQETYCDNMKEMMKSAITMRAEKNKDAAAETSNALNALSNAEERECKLEAGIEAYSAAENRKKQ